MARFSLFDKSHTTKYLKDVNKSNSELAKKERFIQYITRMYESDADVQGIISSLSLGAERIIANIPRHDKVSYGRADTQTETIIIEWEKDLKRTGKHAEEQLSEYLTGNWNSGRRYQFTLVATDGITWIQYAPDWSRLAAANFSLSASYELREVRRFELSEETVEAFPFFLDELLFRERQREPTTENIRADFGDTSSAFINSIQTLSAIAANMDSDTELKTAFEQWRRFLSVAYGKFDDSPQMFMVHTYLSVFSKLLAYTVLVGKPVTTDDEVISVLSGDAFLSLSVERFVEDDFFHWIASEDHFRKCIPVFREINLQMSGYHFESVKEDILKGIYQELIDLETRHALGEYYTPDWLCEKVVGALAPEPGSKILDPACGSGSFLRAAIAHIRNTKSNVKASEIAESIYGIDIHPLSVQIAKTTVILAIADLIRASSRPISIRIFLANSVLVPEESADIFRSIYTVSVDNQQYKVNLSGISNSSEFDSVIDICSELVEQYDELLSAREFMAFFNEFHDVRYRNWAADLFPLYTGMKEAKDAGRDSIWKFIIQNSYKPVFLNGTFDYVIGNPPWLTYKAVTNSSYQNNLRELAVRYGVLPQKRANMTHLEIAAIFLGHSTSYFLKEGGKISFVLPRSFITGDQHERTRAGATDALTLHEIWDLQDVSPLFRVPCCVFFGTKKIRAAGKNADYRAGFRGKVASGRLPKAEVSRSVAESLVSWQNVEWYLNKLRMGKSGYKTAFSNRKLQFGNSVNAYYEQFTQGATLLPRTFYFVEALDGKPLIMLDGEGEKDGKAVFSIQTSAPARLEAKKPWKEVFFKGRIESRFVFRTALSRNVVPFALVDPIPVVLPIEIDERTGSINLKTSTQLLAEGHRYASRWFKGAEDSWDKYRTAKSSDEQRSLLWRLDYQHTLTSQPIRERFMVLYTSSSKDASACVLDRSDREISSDRLDFIADHKTYWFSTNDEEEAYYLIAFLNSGFVNDVIKDFQTYGLMGARDVHKTVLGVPLPPFNKRNPIHLDLATLGKRAAQKAGGLVADKKHSELSMHALGSLRSAIRKSLAEDLQEIDGIIAKLTGLPTMERLKAKKKPRRKESASQRTLPGL